MNHRSLSGHGTNKESEIRTSEDETLLVGRDALLVLDLGLDVVDGVRGLHFERDRLSGEGLDEDLHGWSRDENFNNNRSRRKLHRAMTSYGETNAVNSGFFDGARSLVSCDV